MNQNYADKPKLPDSHWLSYVIFALIIQFALGLFAVVRLAQVMLDDLHWLQDAVPPLADLFFLIALLVFCVKTLTLWGKLPAHPRCRQMRTVIVVMLINSWLFFIIGSYAETLVRCLAVTHL